MGREERTRGFTTDNSRVLLGKQFGPLSRYQLLLLSSRAMGTPLVELLGKSLGS